MKHDLLNAAGLLFVLALSIWGGRPAPSPAASERAEATDDAAEVIVQRDGTRALRDARGSEVPLRAYRRIASASLLADGVLLELSEPERVVAFTRYAAKSPDGHRYGDKAVLSSRDDVERVLALKPDLVLVSDLIDPGYVARLRERGVQVFDLGPMHGLRSLEHGIRSIGLLLGQPARAERHARRLRARLEAIAPGARGPSAMYVSRYGDKLFASGAGTSYHDVLTFAGLRDAAAEAGLSGWPELSAERVLQLDPEILLTREGMRATLCAHPGLDRSRACRGQGRIIELDGALLDDPGPTMVEAAEALRRAVVRAK